jgi:hypothetical protein
MSYREAMNDFRESVDSNLLGVDEVSNLIDMRDSSSGDMVERTKRAIDLRLEQLDQELYDVNKQIKNGRE